MKKLNYKAPFLEDGSVPNYPSTWAVLRGKYQEVEIEWREVEPFFADVRFTGLEHGSHGSNRFTAENVMTGAKYCVFNSSVLDILTNYGIKDNHLAGMWQVCKRGQNYGIQYMGAGGIESGGSETAKYYREIKKDPA